MAPYYNIGFEVTDNFTEDLNTGQVILESENIDFFFNYENNKGM